MIHEATEAVYNLIHAAPRPWLDIQNDIGQTPLHLSVLTGQPKIVRRLMVAGAKTGIRDVEGNTPLHLACLHQRTDCAKELLNPLSQDLEQWNYNGKSTSSFVYESIRGREFQPVLRKTRLQARC